MAEGSLLRRPNEAELKRLRILIQTAVGIQQQQPISIDNRMSFFSGLMVGLTAGRMMQCGPDDFMDGPEGYADEWGREYEYWIAVVLSSVEGGEDCKETSSSS